MGRAVAVLSATRANRNGMTVTDIKCDPGGGANVTAEHAQPAGDDSHPLPTDYAAVSSAAGTGRQTAVGYFDTANTPKTQPGEKRIYARDTAGALVVEVWLQNDGSCVVTNGAGTLLLQPDGEFNINGARITTDGDVITAAGVSLDNHTHAQGADSDGNGQVETNPPTSG